MRVCVKVYNGVPEPWVDVLSVSANVVTGISVMEARV